VTVPILNPLDNTRLSVRIRLYTENSFQAIDSIDPYAWSLACTSCEQLSSREVLDDEKVGLRVFITTPGIVTRESARRCLP
jgi:hypothetical protein